MSKSQQLPQQNDAATPAVRYPHRRSAGAVFGLPLRKRREPTLPRGYANWVAILAFQQILDDSLKIGVFNVSLAPGATHAAKVVECQKNIPVDAGGLSRVRYPFHTSTQLNMIQKTSLRIWFLLSKELELWTGHSSKPFSRSNNAVAMRRLNETSSSKKMNLWPNAEFRFECS